MERFFAFAVIALMCLPALVSCKKDKTSSSNFFKIDGEEQTIILARSYEDLPDEYFLTIKLEGNLEFLFELSRANKGKTIDLLKPDPLAPMPKALISGPGDITYYSIVVYDSEKPLEEYEIASGDPAVNYPALGEGSYMKIDEKNGKIVLDFELRNCRFSQPFNIDGITDGATISGHYDGFEKYIAPPK